MRVFRGGCYGMKQMYELKNLLTVSQFLITNLVLKQIMSLALIYCMQLENKTEGIADKKYWRYLLPLT